MGRCNHSVLPNHSDYQLTTHTTIASAVAAKPQPIGTTAPFAGYVVFTGTVSMLCDRNTPKLSRSTYAIQYLVKVFFYNNDQNIITFDSILRSLVSGFGAIYALVDSMAHSLQPTGLAGNDYMLSYCYCSSSMP